jgi:hypothetical protein
MRTGVDMEDDVAGEDMEDNVVLVPARVSAKAVPLHKVYTLGTR